MQGHKRKRYLWPALLCVLLCTVASCGEKKTKPQSIPDDRPITEQSDLQNSETEEDAAQIQNPEAEDDEEDTAQIQNPEAEDIVVQVPEPEEVFKEKKYTAANVYLRAEASGQSKDLALLVKGSVVYQSSQEDEWSHVKDRAGNEGYVYSKYLTDKKPVKTQKNKKSEKSEKTKKTEVQNTNGKRIVIDPGHQEHANSTLEPLGPGSDEMKAKVTGGTSGVSTGTAEYQLNLDVSLKLRDELQRRGYEVIMIRETNDVDIGNRDRAEIANNADADVFVRIHANGSQDSSAAGMMTICQTESNPYNGQLYRQSRKLSEDILDCAAAATGAEKEYVWETDSMSGINWCQVPVTIFEMGYMSNPQEDERLSQSDYQDRIAGGVADGIDRFFAES